MFNPEEDGVTHINVYSKGQTQIGRMLSNFYHSPFKLAEDGEFKCLEGYWYWLQIQDIPGRDILRELAGWECKKFGRKLRDSFPSPRLDPMEFRKKIAIAIASKVEQNPRIIAELKRSTLPFVHYYNYAGRVVVPEDNEWIMLILEWCRNKVMPR
jgi:hypothetical protein